jgi:DNA-binding transcriptional LysR family regulator
MFMTPTQIEYFLMAARCLNFTEAANRLYITQPALSRQIAVIEENLGFDLFVRGGKTLELTPAGEVLLEELPKFIMHYNKIIEKAKAKSYGFSGTLHVGMLEGNILSEPFTRVFHDFTRIYPNIQIVLESFSYTGLIKGINDESLDIIVTLNFDLNDRNNLESLPIGESETHIVLRKDLIPKKPKDFKLRNLKHLTFLCVVPTESGQSAMRTINICRSAGFEPRIQYAPSVTTLMLWVEAGLGVAFLHGENALRENPNIAFLKMEKPQILDVSLAWRKEDTNELVPIFIDLFKQ